MKRPILNIICLIVIICALFITTILVTSNLENKMIEQDEIITGLEEQLLECEQEKNHLELKNKALQEHLDILDDNTVDSEETVDLGLIEDDLSDEDVYWLSRIISAESKGEPIEGQIAVGNVIMNRIKSDKFPDTIKDVVFQKNQFSPVINGSINDVPTEQAIESANKVLSGQSVIGQDVLYFYNPKGTSRGNWIRSRKVVHTIGTHRFAK